MLTPLDIHNKEFRRSFRGYNEDEVDEFLDQVVRDFEIMTKENAELKERLAELDSEVARFKKLEETLNNTLVVAQATAEEVKNNAHKEAELIIKDAQRQAAEILEEARRKYRECEASFENLKGEIQTFKARMRAMLHSYLELLDEEGAENVDGRSATGDFGRDGQTKGKQVSGDE
ncbi:MAG TPA: DivIVA domain-containing protein [Firmicutes bacterium]|nr:DivIVA domain-containing protein [Bacillota bacterium]